MGSLSLSKNGKYRKNTKDSTLSHRLLNSLSFLSLNGFYDHLSLFLSFSMFFFRYESGTLADIWPLGQVSLSLRQPFLTNIDLATTVLHDVLYPETPITLEDIHLVGNLFIPPISEITKKRVRSVHKLHFFFFCVFE